MAKYESILTIRGTIDDLTFRNTAEGKIVGRKTGPTREKVLTHKNFELTRTNASEFRQAIKDATLLRGALGSILDGVRCTTLNGHVNGLLHRAGQADKQHGYGNRCAAAGDISVLTGFDFNKKLSLDTVLPMQPVHSLDAATGIMKVDIASFVAYKRKGYCKEATHFRMVSCGALLNFSNNSYSNNIQSSELLPLSRKTPGDIRLEHRLNGKPGDVLVQAVGIQLYKLVDGEEVLVKGGAVRILEAARIRETRIPETRIEDELHEGIKRQEGNKMLTRTKTWENFTIAGTGYGQGVFKNYAREDLLRTHFLNCCPFHNQNPESTITGKQTIWVKRAAKCSEATGP